MILERIGALNSPILVYWGQTLDYILVSLVQNTSSYTVCTGMLAYTDGLILLAEVKEFKISILLSSFLFNSERFFPPKQIIYSDILFRICLTLNYQRDISIRFCPAIAE